MRADDYEAVIYQGAVYCVDCCPVPVEAEDVTPIFASDEWDHAPTCDTCGEIHDYMNLIEPPICHQDDPRRVRMAREVPKYNEIVCGNIAALENEGLTQGNILFFRKNTIEMAEEAGLNSEKAGKYFDKLLGKVIEEAPRESVSNDDPDEEQAQEFIERPFSVLVPWVPGDERTAWHPTEQFGQWSVLTRGAFQTEKEARQWAREHLNGNPYSVVKR